MEICWTENLVEELHRIVLFLKKHNIGQLIEKLADFYIQKTTKISNIQDYTMDFAESVDSENINDGEYKLAYICELIHNIKNNGKVLKLNVTKRKSTRLMKNPKQKTNVYIYFSQMIKFCILDIFKIYTNKTDFKIFYLVSILKDKFVPERDSQKIQQIQPIRGVDPILEIFNLSYFLTTEIINTCKNDDTIFCCNSLILETENLDISFLSNQESREILQILNTKRTLYLRILLVLSYEILKINDVFNPMWIAQTLSFDSYDSLVNILTSPLIEILILLTAHRIEI